MTTNSLPPLSPAQQAAFDWCLDALPTSSIFHCWCDDSLGRSTVLRQLHGQLGGTLLTMRDFVDLAQPRHPLSLEEALYQLLLDALREHDVVIVDDMHVAAGPMSGGCTFYPRAGYLAAPMTAIAALATEAGKKLILGTDGNLPRPLKERAFSFNIEAFTVEDYIHLGAVFLDKSEAKSIDFGKIFRFAPKLNAHQIKAAFAWCRHRQEVTTERVISYLRTQQLTSNVALGEVADVALEDLKGVDDVLKSLEVNVVLALENDALATSLQLKPKRGVLLVGPPGTGKTTVGRALAHRLKGKFFLVDGTFISGTRDFYQMIHSVFAAAQENAPAVIFIDDSDVIFESGQEHGLYRYLLTMLDGLESKSAGRVCVMMTAMDVGNLPPALIRSGRIELWLEMRLPDADARSGILEQLIKRAPKPLDTLDLAVLVEASDQFSGADLKRMFEDGKALYAFDVASGTALLPLAEYFQQAAEIIRTSKRRYAEAEARANANRPTRPVWFNPNSVMCSDD